MASGIAGAQARITSALLAWEGSQCSPIASAGWSTCWAGGRAATSTATTWSISPSRLEESYALAAKQKAARSGEE
jgi:hypothetical protein